MKRVFVLALILCLFSTFAFAMEYGEYAEIIKNHYEVIQKKESVVKNWATGLKKSYDVKLDHLTMNFEFLDGFTTTEKDVIICGVLTTTAYCLKNDGSKIRISQLCGIAILIKDSKIDGVYIIKEHERHVLQLGWNGIPV